MNNRTVSRMTCLAVAAWLVWVTAAPADERDHPIIKAVLAGKAPNAGDLKSKANPAKPLSALMPNFRLPAHDSPRFVSMSDFAADSVVVVHLARPNDIEAVTADVLLALKKRLGGSGLNIVTMLLDEGSDSAKLAAHLKERAIDWPVTLDDHAEFREFVVRENYYLPSFLVVGHDRKAQWISMGRLEESLASLCRTVEEEISRRPGKRAPGPEVFFPLAEPFSASAISGGNDNNVRFGTKPAFVVATQADDNGVHLKALSEVAKRFADKLDVIAVVASESPEQARAFAKGKPFRVLHEQSALPGCFGPRNRYRLAVVSPSGRVLKVMLLNPSFDHYLPIYERLARLLTTPNALPAEANAPGRSNIALQASGGHIESATTATDGAAAALIDGAIGHAEWTTAPKTKPEVVLSFRGGQPVKIDRVWLDVQSPIQDVEILAGDDLKRAFRSLGTFRLEDRRGIQALPLLGATAKYLKVRLVSSYDSNVPFALGEIGVEEIAGVATTAAFQNGFRDEFAEGRLTYWQQEDVGNIRPRPVWKIEKGKLSQPRSPLIRGFDHRCTALLHSYPAKGDFRFQATVTKPRGLLAGVVFGFRDWDNFDSLYLLEAQVLGGRHQGNSVRLERRRNGRTQVLSIHGEWFDQSMPVRLEVVSRGLQLAVRANDRLIMSVRNDAPVAPGRVGLCTAGASDCSFAAVQLTPLGENAPSLPEMNPLSTAAGATIVWLSGQGSEKEPSEWATHLLRDAALAAPGAWVAPRTDGKPPEVIFAFRDAREVLIEQVGFTLPSIGDPRARAKSVEVLVSRDSPLVAERFRSAGTFALEDRATVQTFRLSKPAPARFLMIRLRENRGADKTSLARVSVQLGPDPIPEKVTATSRTEVEQSFATAAPAQEVEPNDTVDQATTLIDGKDLDAAIQPGEVDLFRFPNPPAKKGRASLNLQVTALPWLRLQADLLDSQGKPIPPPLIRPQTGQVFRSTHSTKPPPAFARVEMPNASLSVVLDMSGSMGGREKDVGAVVKTFFEGVTATEQIEVVRFASDVAVMVPFTNDRQKLEPVSRQIRFNGATALYKALLKAMDNLSNRGGHRAILLLSDGMNTIPGEDFADLCRRLRAQPVPIYVVGVGQDLFEYDAASGNTCADLLRNLALVTGGRYYFAPTSGELGALYLQIAGELRGATRYRIRAEWEVSDQSVELMATVPAMAPRPFAGEPIPSSFDLSVDPMRATPGPHAAGIPPAPAELSPVPLLAQAPTASPLLLPMPFEVAVDPPPVPAPMGFLLPLPGVPELADTRVDAGLPKPAAIDSLPEFGAVALRYSPTRPGDPLPSAIRPAFELILDSSGSMKELVEGQPKYLAAQRVMTDLLKALPDDATVGLRIFGHMRFWDPTKEPMPDAADVRYKSDSELVVSIGQLSSQRRKVIKEWIDYLTPKGATPLVYSLIKASKDFPANWIGPKTVVIVSDGMETCGGKLDDVEKAYRGTDVNLIIHVVGFDVKDAKEQEYLSSLARIGRGQYFNASNARQLTDALNKAMRSLGFQVQNEAGKVVAEGIINDPPLELPAGAYSIVVPGTMLKPVRIRLGDGKLVPVTLGADGQLAAPRP